MMCVQFQQYVEDMSKMYLEIMKKDRIDVADYLFLKLYQKTIDNSIYIPNVGGEK